MRQSIRPWYVALVAGLLVLPQSRAAAGTITLPFEQDKDHRIYVEGRINQSGPLRFLVDTGADGLAVTVATRKAASMQVDDRSENTGSDGVSFVDYSTHNTVVVGDMRRTMGAAVIDYGKRPFDAVLGWTFFAGRIIEIDYDRKLLHVHDRLPDLHGYTRANVRWIDNTPAIEVLLREGGSTLAAWLFVDTGSNGAIDLGHAYSSRHRLQEVFTRTIGTSQFSGSAGRKIRAVDARIASADVGGLRLEQPKVSFTIDEDGSNADGTLGSEALRNFNILLDTGTGQLHLRPNGNARALPN